jgi:ribose transport system substrate-binding protein
VSLPTIAVFTKNRSNPAYAAARLGAERTAARLGGRVAHYVPETPDSIPEQIALVERALAERPDAFVFVPVHETAINDAVRRINAAGIPIFNIINRLTAGDYVSFVGADDYRLAREVARYLFRHLGGKGEAFIVEGAPGAVTGQARLRGFHDAARECPGIRIAGSRCGAFLRGTARQEMRALLASPPPIDGILCANDDMALGVIEALQERGLSVPVTGVNAVPEAVTALKAGRLLATADFDALKISCVATEAALRHLRGEAVPHAIELPAEVVNAENCRPWDKPLEERGCPNWDDVVKERQSVTEDKRG